ESGQVAFRVRLPGPGGLQFREPGIQPRVEVAVQFVAALPDRRPPRGHLQARRPSQERVDVAPEAVEDLGTTVERDRARLGGPAGPRLPRTLARRGRAARAGPPAARPGGVEAAGAGPARFRLRYETAKMARQASTASTPALSDMAVTSFVAAGDWAQVGALRVSISLSTVEVTFATQRLQ